LVWVKPDAENGLQIDSYVDCNTYFAYTINDFQILYEKEEIEFGGKISEGHFVQIVTGLLESPLIEKSVKEQIRNLLEA
jgi:hypothetical protein